MPTLIEIAGNVHNAIYILSGDEQRHMEQIGHDSDSIGREKARRWNMFYDDLTAAMGWQSQSLGRDTLRCLRDGRRGNDQMVQGAIVEYLIRLQQRLFRLGAEHITRDRESGWPPS